MIARARAPATARALPLAALVVAIVSVQYGATYAKRLFPLIGAEGTTGLRLLLAAVILCAVLRPWRRWSRVGLGPAVGYGIALGGMNLLFYMALRTVPLGIAVALEFAGPLAVALFGARRPVDFAWAVLAAAGLALLLPIGPSIGTLDVGGTLLALGAGVCWALYIVFGKRAGAAYGAATSAIGAVVAAVVIVPFGVAHAGAAMFAPPVLAMGLVVAILSSALPNAMEMFALTRMPAQAFGTLMSAEPAAGALMGLALLGEHLTPLQWLAIGAIIAASAGTTVTIRPPAEVPD